MMEFKKGDRVQMGPFVGVVTGVGRRALNRNLVWVKFTQYAGYVGGEQADPPCYTVVDKEKLRHIKDVPEKYR
jgi:hypothetical protein